MAALRLKEASLDKDLHPIFRSCVSDAIATYEDFTQVIHSHLKRTFKDMTRSCNYFEGQSEDQITFHVLSHLNAFGFRASHDPHVGGHVDICVEYDDYLWLAEAKKHSTYIHLQRGWEQLTSRYSTGMKDEDDGAFIIYNFNSNALSVTNAWKSHLEEFYSNVNCAHEEGELNFKTTHSHVRSGRPYSVTHYNVPLHFDPKDRNL